MGQGIVLQHAPGLTADLFGGNPQPVEHVRGGAFVFENQPEQQVFGPDVLMAQLAGFLNGVPYHLLGARGKLHPVGGRPSRREDPLDHLLDPLFLQAKIAQHACGHPAFLLKQSQEKVFGADFALVHALSLLMSQAEHSAGPLGETIQTFCHSDLPFRPKNEGSDRPYHSTKFKYADYQRESALLPFFQGFLID
jgi:hypothetical protein